MKILIVGLCMLLLSSCSMLQGIFSSNDDHKDAKPEPTPSVASLEADHPEVVTKRRILVLKFVNKTRLPSEAFGEQTVHDVRASLSHLRDTILVSGEEIEGPERFITDGREYNFRAIFERARANAITAIVTGAIDDIQLKEKGDEVGLFRTRYSTAEATVKVQAFEASTEKEIYFRIGRAEVTEERTGVMDNQNPDEDRVSRSRSAVSKALSQTLSPMHPILQRLSWVGRIAKADLHRYYINAGESTGLARGQLLKVFGEGQPIFDPETQSLIGIAPGRFKGLLKVVDLFGGNGAVAVVHSGAGFREKDRVEVYTPPAKP